MENWGYPKKTCICGSCESFCNGEGFYRKGVYTPTILICHVYIKSRSLSPNVIFVGINMDILLSFNPTM
jgi:hypothetical protein